MSPDFDPQIISILKQSGPKASPLTVRRVIKLTGVDYDCTAIAVVAAELGYTKVALMLLPFCKSPISSELYEALVRAGNVKAFDALMTLRYPATIIAGRELTFQAALCGQVPMIKYLMTPSMKIRLGESLDAYAEFLAIIFHRQEYIGTLQKHIPCYAGNRFEVAQAYLADAKIKSAATYGRDMFMMGLQAGAYTRWLLMKLGIGKAFVTIGTEPSNLEKMAQEMGIPVTVSYKDGLIGFWFPGHTQPEEWV